MFAYVLRPMLAFATHLRSLHLGQTITAAVNYWPDVHKLILDHVKTDAAFGFES